VHGALEALISLVLRESTSIYMPNSPRGIAFNMPKAMCLRKPTVQTTAAAVLLDN